MRSIPPLKTYIEHLSVAIFIIFGILLFAREEYGWSVLCIALLLVLARLDTLKTFIMSPKDGFRFEFDKKIVENIRENNEPVTESTYNTYRQIEDQVVQDLISRYGSKASVAREYSFGRYRADILVKTPTENIIYEVKYVRGGAVEKIINNGIRQLQTYAELLPKGTMLRLIVASKQSIDLSGYKTPVNVAIEHFKI
jgi:hypothetical protein